MNVLTYTAVVGSNKCNARCPFCVSAMTPHYEQSLFTEQGQFTEHAANRFKAGARLASKGGATTFLITGKGEPLLYPEQITTLLRHATDLFPLAELQTNGLRLMDRELNHYLVFWPSLGLHTIAISCLHWDPKINRMMRPETDLDLPLIIQRLQYYGYTVRLSVIMVKGAIDSAETMLEFINWARIHKVDQLTFRPVDMPMGLMGPMADWVRDHLIDPEVLVNCRNTLDLTGTLLLRLEHGAEVFDVDGQNVCLTNCLTLDPSKPEIRQLIFCSDGHVRYDWRRTGAILF